MIFARLQEIWILNKREEGTVESLTAGPARQRPREQGTHSPANARRQEPSPADPRAPTCSWGDSASMEVGDTRVIATERGRRRPWRHDGATPAYAGHLRPVERRERAA